MNTGLGTTWKRAGLYLARLGSSVRSGLEQERCSSRDCPWDLPTQPSPSGLRAMPGGQMHMKVPIRFLHIMPRDSQSCSPSAHSSRSRRQLLKYLSKGERKSKNSTLCLVSYMLVVFSHRFWSPDPHHAVIWCDRGRSSLVC